MYKLQNGEEHEGVLPSGDAKPVKHINSQIKLDFKMCGMKRGGAPKAQPQLRSY